MAVLPIRITGDPVLHARAQEVEEIDEGLSALVHDMEDTMSAAPGVGLAAPQVGIPLRLFVYNWRDEEGTLHRGTAINPQLLISPPPIGEADVDDDSEGCLSIPGERFPLLRSHTALLRAVELDGTAIPAAHLGYSAPGATQLTLSSGAEAARILLLGGEPFGEEIVMWWNFVGRSHDEIVASRSRWMAEVIDSGDPDGQFGLVNGYDGRALPAPELPLGRLRAR